MFLCSDINMNLITAIDSTGVLNVEEVAYLQEKTLPVTCPQETPLPLALPTATIILLLQGGKLTRPRFI